MASAVPSEYELVEIALDVCFPQAVKGALRPPLEVRKDAVDPVQEFVRLSAFDAPRFMGVCRRVLVAEPAVGNDMSAGLDRAGDEAVEDLARPVAGCARA